MKLSDLNRKTPEHRLFGEALCPRGPQGVATILKVIRLAGEARVVGFFKEDGEVRQRSLVVPRGCPSEELEDALVEWCGELLDMSPKAYVRVTPMDE